MLLYFANGSIRWRKIDRCNTRTNWEIYAVIDGRCAPVFNDDDRPPLQEKTRWIFAPECSHAWMDDGRQPFRRVICGGFSGKCATPARRRCFNASGSKKPRSS